MFYVNYIVVFVLLVCRSSSAEEEERSCIGLNSSPGTCVVFRKCDPILTLFKKSASFIKAIESASAQCNLEREEVCCPNESAELVIKSTPGLELPSFEDGCGQLSESRSRTKRIIGGEEAKIGYWPWIALLGYDSNSITEFKCGGTIITKRHVLTAAHCIRPSLVFVRLGEHDLTKDNETTHVDIKIRKALKHPSFSRTSNAGRSNIGLLYLEKDIQFTDKIKPICLPITPKLRHRSYEGSKSYIAGWGRFSTRTHSDVLLQAEIEVYSNLDCENIFKNTEVLKKKENIDDAFLCAINSERPKDSCSGDGGGPLLNVERVETNHYRVLIAIVSTGSGCGIVHAPSLYTNTSYYMDWIEENVRKPF